MVRTIIKEFYHQILAALMVHPELNTVLPIAFEPITKRDGDNKNDCERNAAKRLLVYLDGAVPQRNFLIVEDDLASNGPHTELLCKLGIDFILGVKSDGSQNLFEQVSRRQCYKTLLEWQSEVAGDGSWHGYRFTNGLTVNDLHSDLMINYIECWEMDKNNKDGTEGAQHIFSWATSLEVTIDNVRDNAQAGRTRSYRLPASPLRNGHAPLSVSGSPLRCGVPPWQHHLPMLPACTAFHQLSKVFTSLWSINLSHKHTRAAPLRHLVGFPLLGLLRELRQSA